MNDNQTTAATPVNGAQVDLTKRPVEVPQTTETPKTDKQPDGSDAPVKA